MQPGGRVCYAFRMDSITHHRGISGRMAFRAGLLLAPVWMLCLMLALLAGPLFYGLELTYASGAYGPGEIVSLDITRGIAFNLTTHYAPSSGKPLWSPDGQRLAFVAQHDDTYHIIVTDADGSRPRDLLPLINGGIRMTWSPDSRALAVSVLRRLYVVNVMREDYVELPVAGALVGWSAGGQMLFKSLERPGEISAFNPDEETLALLFEDARLTLLPLVSPDGTQLVYVGEDTEGQGELYVRPLAGGTSRRLTAVGAYRWLEILSWSPDGRSIAFSAYQPDRRNELYSVDVREGAVRQLTDNTEFESAFAWSPDGRAVTYVTRSARQSSLYLLDLTTGIQRFIAPFVGAYDSLTWRR